MSGVHGWGASGWVQREARGRLSGRRGEVMNDRLAPRGDA